MSICKLEDCLREVHAKGLCPAHYQRMKFGYDMNRPLKVMGEHRGTNPSYGSYKAMLYRCNSPKSKYYTYYGGRGIKVCKRWQGVDGFKNFQQDMGIKPPGMTIERVNNDLGYTPKNCIWASRTQQVRNQRISKVNTSGYKGVHYYAATGKWSAHIYEKRVKRHLGYFNNIDDAIAARMSAELKYYD